MPELYKSSDASAPQLTQQKGSFNNVLKTYLLSTGWSLEYENTTADLCVFSNQLGYLCSEFDRIGVQKIRACEAYVNGECINPTPYVYVLYNVTGYIQYAIVADQKAIYLKIDAGADRAINQVYFFGRFVSVIPGDLYNFAIAGLDSSLNNSALCAYRSGAMFVLKNRLGSTVAMLEIVSAYATGWDIIFGSTINFCAYPYYGACFIESPWLVEDGLYPRGKLPGFIIAKHQATDLMKAVGIIYRSNFIGETAKLVAFENRSYFALHTRKGIIFIDRDKWGSL